MPDNTPKLSLRSIPDLIAAVPYLLGFHPAQSVVVVAFRGRRLVFAARLDLPPVDAGPDVRQAAAAHLAAVVTRQGIERVSILGYGSEAEVTPTVTALTYELARAELE
ncbi:MAG TPA: DUF4192 family protein, partial [Micromonosporaceae bacterium]